MRHGFPSLRLSRRALLAGGAALLAGPGAWAQGFAGLGQGGAGYAQAGPGRGFDFPADHGPHPAFRVEWWYVTANLTDADGRPMGAQWTLFRTALRPPSQAGDSPGGGWSDPQLWMGHAALTTADIHLTAERLARGGIGQAGVTADPFAARIDDWSMAGPDFDHLTIRAAGPTFAYDLALTARGPLVAQGEAGYSVKSPSGQASLYYSQPFFEVAGEVTLPDGPRRVTGTAWLDREISSQPLDETQAGWDWIALSLDDGARVMGFQLRNRDGGRYTRGTWIAPDGTPDPLDPAALRLTPLDTARVAGREVPVRWRVELPARGLDVTLAALNPQAWMDMRVPYWEGPVTVSGSHSGHGYLEMTGYE